MTTRDRLEIANVTPQPIDSLLRRAAKLIALPWSHVERAIPETLPLPPAFYLPQLCPACGHSGQWANVRQLAAIQDLDASVLAAPATLSCRSCGECFPNSQHPENQCESVGSSSYAFHQDKHGRRYRFSACAADAAFQALGYRNTFAILCTAYDETGDNAYAERAMALLRLFAKRFQQWPLLAMHRHDDNAPLTVLEPTQLGQTYGGWWRTWGGSYMVTEWCLFLPLLDSSNRLTEADKEWLARDVVQPVLEYHTYPTLLYFLDRYHNSTTNHYRAIASAARLFGAHLEVKDVVHNTFQHRGGDILQDVLFGPRGLSYFIANCFDSNGFHFERASGYQGYASNGALAALNMLRGYSEPPDYVPSPAVRPFYQALHNFVPEAQFPELQRAIDATDSLHHHDGFTYVLGDSGPPSYARCDDAGYKSGYRHDTTCMSNDLLAQCMGLALLRQVGDVPSTLGLSWSAHQDYHSHFDNLRLTYRVGSQSFITDAPTCYASPLRYHWTDRTRAHATVIVDGQNQAPSTGGELCAYERGDGIAYIAACDRSVYPKINEYRRDVVTLRCSFGEVVVDCFQVYGATTSTQCWPGPDAPVHATPALPIDVPQSPPTYDDLEPTAPDADYNGAQIPQRLGGTTTTAPGIRRLTWQLDGAVGALYICEQANDELEIARYPADITAAPPRLGTMFGITRRGDRTVFLSVIAVADEAAIAGLSILPVPVENGHGLRITTNSDSHTIAFRTGPKPLFIPSAAVQFDGDVYHVCHNNATVHAFGGRQLNIADLAVPATIPSFAAPITAFDHRHGMLRVRLTSPVKLTGRHLRIQHHRDISVVQVSKQRSVANGEIELSLEGGAAALVRQTLFVERVEGRCLVSQTPLADDPRVGDAVYVESGFVGHIASIEHSGRPLTLDGRTTNNTARQVRLMLDRTISLSTPAQLWCSPIRLGDMLTANAVFQTSIPSPMHPMSTHEEVMS